MTEVSSFNSISKNIITSSPYTIYQAGILASIVTGDPKYILFSVFAFIMGDGFNALEKKIAKKIMVGGQRPSGCGNGQRRSERSERSERSSRTTGGRSRTTGGRSRTTHQRRCTGCGIYPSHGTKSKTWGMPSGHAQITSFAATFWTLYVWLKYKKESRDLLSLASAQNADPLAKNKAIASTAIMWTLAACVWSQRVISLCHSIPQIIVGVIFGILFGVLAYFISTFIIKDLPLF